MNTEIVKTVLLHSILLASQAFYMYLSNKAQLKSSRRLYIAAIPLVLALPAVFSLESHTAYLTYEYAIVFCMITAMLADTTYAAVFNKEFFSDTMICSLHYSYFIICLAAAFCVGTGVLIKVIAAVILAAAFFFLCIMKRHSPAEFAKAVPLALLSFAGSWAFINYVL